MVSDFTSNLDSMESMLDTMLRGLDHAAAVSKKAREAQQKLFDSHQKVRYYYCDDAIDCYVYK